MNYGADIREQFYQVGSYAARILRGERPADLPVRRPTNLVFALNLKTARSLGIEPSPTLLSLADEVIELHDLLLRCMSPDSGDVR